MAIKTIVFWLEKGCRKPKQAGLATAPDSVHLIDEYCRMAREGRGRLFIVDAHTASEGREHIASWRKKESTPHAIGSVILGPDRIVALGMNACAAIAGAAAGKRAWDARLARQGIVKIDQTRALDAKDPLANWTPGNAFGQGLGDAPEPGKQYRLTGGRDVASIAGGASWRDSEVK